jgi:hypothetical protein
MSAPLYHQHDERRFAYPTDVENKAELQTGVQPAKTGDRAHQTLGASAAFRLQLRYSQKIS